MDDPISRMPEDIVTRLQLCIRDETEMLVIMYSISDAIDEIIRLRQELAEHIAVVGLLNLEVAGLRERLGEV